jgi:catechol 2,3-dioxygenase-like lactoylglutathione lyase family enzyme
MTVAKFKEVNPCLPARDVEKALRFYVDRLGFRHSFGKASNNYVGVRRDGVELHLWWQREEDFQAGKAGQAMLRFVVDDPDALFAEYEAQGVLREGTCVEDKPWGTREFAFFDPDGNGLTFYRDL